MSECLAGELLAIRHVKVEETLELCLEQMTRKFGIPKNVNTIIIICGNTVAHTIIELPAIEFFTIFTVKQPHLICDRERVYEVVERGTYESL